VKSILKRLLGPGLWSDLRVAVAASRRLGRGLVDRFRPRLRLRDVTGERLLLHLGCSNRPKAGWINVDMHPLATVYYADLRDPFDLNNGAVRHIHCEHVLEHLEHGDALRFLRECRRVLADDGTLRLIVPDAEKYLLAYAQEDAGFFAALRHLGNAVEPLTHRMAVINQMFRMGGAHRYAWDFEAVRAALLAAGFARVDRSTFGNIAPELRIDGTDDWRLRESLYVNAFCSEREPAPVALPD
jgi:predicted SAM-dependent methyltransferase